MRCTGDPHTGHGFLNRPWTAIPSRNAVTFSGNPSPVSARRRAIQLVKVCRTAWNSRSLSSGVIRLVRRSGDRSEERRVVKEGRWREDGDVLKERTDESHG